MLPKTAKIGSTKWKIQYVSDLRDSETGEPLEGQTNPASRLIQINSDFSEARQEQTLYHEFMHAALYESGLTHIIPDDIEEAAITALENILWPLIRLR